MRGEVEKKTPKKDMDNPSFLLHHMNQITGIYWASSLFTGVNSLERMEVPPTKMVINFLWTNRNLH